MARPTPAVIRAHDGLHVSPVATDEGVAYIDMVTGRTVAQGTVGDYLATLWRIEEHLSPRRRK